MQKRAIDLSRLPPGSKLDAAGHIAQIGPFDPADLDADGTFNVDKSCARLRLKHRDWNTKHNWRPEWKQ